MENNQEGDMENVMQAEQPILQKYPSYLFEAQRSFRKKYPKNEFCLCCITM